jgi:poly(3-hydroxybutyrate) depolymerase
VISQWAQTNDLAADGKDNGNIDDLADAVTAGAVPGGRTYTIYSYNDGKGSLVMQKYRIDGMSHAWSGGSGASSYTDPLGPDATELSYSFFMDHPMKQKNR